MWKISGQCIFILRSYDWCYLDIHELCSSQLCYTEKKKKILVNCQSLIFPKQLNKLVKRSKEIKSCSYYYCVCIYIKNACIYVIKSSCILTFVSMYCAVKPGKVEITKAENNEFEWEAPKTWNQPCTFFPLRYEVKVVSHRKDCDETLHDHEGSRSDVSMCSRPSQNDTFKVPNDIYKPLVLIYPRAFTLKRPVIKSPVRRVTSSVCELRIPSPIKSGVTGVSTSESGHIHWSNKPIKSSDMKKSCKRLKIRLRDNNKPVTGRKAAISHVTTLYICAVQKSISSPSSSFSSLFLLKCFVALDYFLLVWLTEM